MCIGANIAKKELLFVAVGLLSRFKFDASVVNNQTQEPSLQGILGLTHVPKSFTVSLKIEDPWVEFLMQLTEWLTERHQDDAFS